MTEAEMQLVFLKRAASVLAKRVLELENIAQEPIQNSFAQRETIYISE